MGMKNGWVFLILAYAGFPAAGCANDASMPKPERQLPVEVRQLIAEMEEECRGVDAVPESSPGLVNAVDLTGDGIDDYVIDQGAFVCNGAASLYFGSGGSQMEIYVGMPDGHARPGFHHGHFGVYIEPTASSVAQVVLGLGGEGCGQDTDGLSRAEFQSCLRPLVWDAERQEFDFAPLSAVRQRDD